jgi:predicted esterase
MKSIFISLLFLLCLANFKVFPQTFCQNTKANSTAGNVEKYVYKQYISEKGKEKQLHIGLVRPIDDLPNKKRPLVIGVHGGGFVNFCPFEPCYALYNERVLTPNFTAHGFITVSVQYRLTSPLDFKPPKIKDETLKESQYKAVQDVRAAIRFISENANKFGVDKENIFLVGTSAGAITVLNAAYLNEEEVPKDLLAKYGRLEKKEKIRGIISLSGALYDLSYLDGDRDDDRIPLMIVHGTEDSIVPIDKGFYLGMKHLTPVFGGRAIYNRAQKNRIPAKAFFYEFGHAYPKKILSDIFKNANDFIHQNLACATGDKSVNAAK